jgi:hypothetical protein
VASSILLASGFIRSVVPTSLDHEFEAPARAVLWNNEGKALDVREMLINQFGLAAELDGWRLTNASHISDDGTVIAGRGLDPNGRLSSWVAVLSIPEPPASVLILTCSAHMALAVLVGSRTRR